MVHSVKKIHVVIVTSLFPNKIEKERGVFIYQLAEELKKYVHLTIVSPLPWFPSSSIFKLKFLDKYYKFSLIGKAIIRVFSAVHPDLNQIIN